MKIEKIEKKENVDLKDFSTIKIGGKAKVVFFPKNAIEIKKILKMYNKTLVFGNASNILFPDDGYSGALINLKNFNKIKIKGNFVFVGAGVNLYKLNQVLCENSLSGLEWSFGIPATLGGFVYMNGGSFGHEICEFVEEVKILKNNKILTKKRKNLQFFYRFSNIDGIILEIKLKLCKKSKAEILEKMQEYLNTKKQTQPLEMPSLGSVFKIITKNGEKIYPAKVIDELGLKGFCVGGAEISSKHAGFIVNNGSATASDVKEVISHIEKQFSSLNLTLEKEIKIIEN